MQMAPRCAALFGQAVAELGFFDVGRKEQQDPFAAGEGLVELVARGVDLLQIAQHAREDLARRRRVGADTMSVLRVRTPGS